MPFAGTTTNAIMEVNLDHSPPITLRNILYGASCTAGLRPGGLPTRKEPWARKRGYLGFCWKMFNRKASLFAFLQAFGLSFGLFWGFSSPGEMDKSQSSFLVKKGWTWVTTNLGLFYQVPWGSAPCACLSRNTIKSFKQRSLTVYCTCFGSRFILMCLWGGLLIPSSFKTAASSSSCTRWRTASQKQELNRSCSSGFFATRVRTGNSSDDE